MKDGVECVIDSGHHGRSLGDTQWKRQHTYRFHSLWNRSMDKKRWSLAVKHSMYASPNLESSYQLANLDRPLKRVMQRSHLERALNTYRDTARLVGTRATSR
jgi:hypothetical protein